MGRAFRVLSLDGGGLRGLAMSIWLRELEAELGCKLRDKFDLIAGSSTGAIVACGISYGMEMDEIIAMFRTCSKIVFPPLGQRLLDKILRMATDGFSSPKYDDKGLLKVLKELFGSTAFGALGPRTMTLSYDAYNNRAVVFKNWVTAYASLTTSFVCRASAAAPGYFAPQELAFEGADIPLLDACIVSSNPSACAVVEAMRIMRQNPDSYPSPSFDDIVVASFGAGSVAPKYAFKDVSKWGFAQWAMRIVDILMSGSDGSVEYIVRQVLKPGNISRIDFPLYGCASMDDSSDAFTQRMEMLAYQYARMDETQRIITELARKLRA